MANYAHAEKRACIERELKMRRRAYPRWIEAGRMTIEQADREIATMQSILADYAEPDLFGGKE